MSIRRSLHLLHKINPFHPSNSTTTTKKPLSTMSSTTTTTTNTHTADTLLQLAKARRSIYPLTKTLPVPPLRIHALVRDAILHTPYFNSQTSRAVVLLGAAAGIVLLFVDADVVAAHQAKMPTFAASFPAWAEQSCVMLQWLVWTALELDGLGANLQHYNRLIDEDVASRWALPASWKLNAQLVFGGRAGGEPPEEFQPIEDRVKVFGA